MLTCRFRDELAAPELEIEEREAGDESLRGACEGGSQFSLMKSMLASGSAFFFV